MTYYKIVVDDNVVSVGCTFLKWNVKRHKLNICDVDEGQFVQTYDEKKIYRDAWLKQAPQEAGEYETAKVVIIDQTEYEDIKELIDEGEEVHEEVIEPEIVEHVEEVVDEEKPMSIAQMRDIITEQQKQIELLINKINSLAK